MKFALCNEMLQQWSLENQFEALAAWGYDGIELAPFSLDPLFVNGTVDVMELTRIDSSIRKRLRSCVATSGVVVSGLHWILAKTQGLHLTTNDEEIRKKTSYYLADLATLCAELGGKYMVLGSPLQRYIEVNQTYEEAEQNVLDTISEVLPTLERLGVVLTLESLAPTETNFWTSAKETLGFIEKLGNTQNVSLHLDCKAMNGGERHDIPTVIKYSSHKIKMISFHTNDPNLQGPGFGSLDFVPILSALKECNFDGWVGIEPFDYSSGILELGKKSIAYLKSCL